MKSNLFNNLEAAISSYNDFCEQSNNFKPLSGDHPSGTCFILFKGTKKDVDELRNKLDMPEIRITAHLFKGEEGED